MKILLILFFIIPAMATEHIIEQYPNDKPELKLVYQSEDLPYSILESNGFVKCKYFHHPLSYFYTDNHHVFVKLSEGELERACYFKQQVRDSCKPLLDEEVFSVNSIIFSKDKWNIPRPMTFSEGEEDKAIPLSWRYIDYALHEINFDYLEKNHIKTSIYEKKLFEDIKKNGLENSLTRFLYQVIYSSNMGELYIATDGLSQENHDFYDKLFKATSSKED